MSGNELTPTFDWDLPPELVSHLNGSQLLNDGNVNRWRVRVNRVNSDRTTGDQVFDSRRSRPQDPKRDLPLTTTSFQVPAGFITEPGRYRVAIMLEGFRPFNRSRARVDFGTDIIGAIVPIITTILLDED